MLAVVFLLIYKFNKKEGRKKEPLVKEYNFFYLIKDMHGRCWLADAGTSASSKDVEHQATVMVGSHRVLTLQCSNGASTILPKGAMMLVNGTCPASTSTVEKLPPPPSSWSVANSDTDNSYLRLCRINDAPRELRKGDVLVGGTETASWKRVGSGGYLHSMLDLDMWSSPKFQWGRQVNEEWLVGTSGRYEYTGPDASVQACIAPGLSSPDGNCDAVMQQYCRGDGRNSAICSCLNSRALSEIGVNPICVDKVCKSSGWKSSALLQNSSVSENCAAACKALAKYPNASFSNNANGSCGTSSDHPCAAYLQVQKAPGQNSVKSNNTTTNFKTSSYLVSSSSVLLLMGAMAFLLFRR